MRICRLEDTTDAELVESVRKGAILIYPTDTIYGMGCNALVRQSVRKIRAMKGARHPLSVIAPSKQWISRHLRVRHRLFLEQLPGRYTLIFEKRDRDFLREVAPGKALGVRLPKHPFTRIIRKAGVPVITTSVNLTGKRPIRRLSSIPHTFLRHVDVVIDGGTLDNPPSQVWDLTGDEPKRLR